MSLLGYLLNGAVNEFAFAAPGSECVGPFNPEGNPQHLKEQFRNILCPVPQTCDKKINKYINAVFNIIHSIEYYLKCVSAA